MNIINRVVVCCVHISIWWAEFHSHVSILLGVLHSNTEGRKLLLHGFGQRKGLHFGEAVSSCEICWQAIEKVVAKLAACV